MACQRYSTVHAVHKNEQGIHPWFRGEPK